MKRPPAVPSRRGPLPRGAVLAALWALFAAVAFGLAQGQPPLRLSLLRALLPPVDALAGPLRHAGALGGLWLFWVLTVGLGRAVLRRCSALRFNHAETLGLSLALGAGLLSAALWVLGAVGALSRAGVLAVTALGLGVVLFDLLKAPPTLPRFSREGLDGPTLTLWLLAAAVLAGAGLLALAPVRFYDALVYHLALPKLYLLEGRWVPTPTNLFGGFPMHTHALFAWALALGDERWAALVHWSFGVGAAALFAGAAARAPHRFGGALAAAVFLSSPVVVFALSRPGVDISTACYTLAAVVWVARALDEAPRARGVWLWAGVLVGWTLGVKYTNLPAGLLWGLALWRLKLPRPSLARFAVGAALAFSPWLVKNLAGYGNPLFPFLQSWFGPSGFLINGPALNADAWGRPWDRVLAGQWALPFQWLLHPWTLTLAGRTEFDFLGPLFLMGLPLLLFVRRDGAARRWPLWALGAVWCGWWLFSSMPRFFLGGLVLLAFLFGEAVSRVAARRARWALALAVLWAAMGPLVRAFYGLSQDVGWAHLAAGANRDAARARPAGTYPAPAHPSMAWINAHGPADARVLVVGDARGFGLERPFRTTSALDTDWFLWMVKKSANEQALADALAAEGFTHLLVNPAEMARVGRPAGFTPDEFQRAARFWVYHTEKLFEDGSPAASPPRWSLVYRLVPRRDAPAVGDIPWLDTLAALGE